MSTATIDDLDVRGRRVLLRVDFNVPLHDGVIGDDRRIAASLPTIRALRQRGARVLIVTHLGRPKGKPAAGLSVRPLAAHLAGLLGIEVPVAGDVVGPSAERLAASLGDGDVAMLENVRFEPGEETDDPGLAARLAALADVFVNDAFGTAHRAHASTEGVAHLLPAVAGYLMAREIEVLSAALNHPARPVVAIIGGAKISSKLGLLTHLLQRVDDLYIGGAMACTFYAARAQHTGCSLVETEQVAAADAILTQARSSRCTVHLPVDVLVAPEATSAAGAHVVSSDAIPDTEMVVDIGPASVSEIATLVATAGTVVWNGPLGIYEVPEFARATQAVARAVAASPALSVVGGGDLGAAIDDAGVADGIDFVSTGGGATLEFLEGRTLPGVAALRQRSVAVPS